MLFRSLHLIVLLGFYLFPLPGTYFSAISFCLTFCVCGLYSSGCSFVFPLGSGVFPLVGEVGPGVCAGFLVGVWCLPTDGWSWVLSLWWTGSSQVVYLTGGSWLRETLGSLSAYGWGCVPTLLVVWPEASQHQSLQAFGWG